MKTARGMEKAKVWISENVGTKVATRLVRGLVLGTLLAAATGIYFSINQGEAGSPLASEQMAVAEDAGIFEETVLPGRYREAPVAAVAEDAAIFEETVLPGRYREAPVAAAGMRDPSEGRLLSSRELERLDYQADVMLIDAVRNQPPSRPLSNRELERMDYAVDVMLRGLD